MKTINTPKKQRKYRTFIVRVPVTDDAYFGTQVPKVIDVTYALRSFFPYVQGITVRRVPEKDVAKIGFPHLYNNPLNGKKA